MVLLLIASYVSAHEVFITEAKFHPYTAVFKAGVLPNLCSYCMAENLGGRNFGGFSGSCPEFYLPTT